MALTKNDAPDTVALVGNQMWVDYTTDEVDEDFIGIHISPEVYLEEEWVVQGAEQRFEPDMNGNVLVDLHRLFNWDPEGRFTWPEDPRELMVRDLDLCRSARIVVKEKYGNPLAEQDSDTHIPLYLLPGKISDLLQGKLNDEGTTWWDDFKTTGKFLTNAPRIKTTDPWASERLFFFPITSYPQGVRLRVKVTYTDGTLKEFNRMVLEGATQFQVHEIITSFSTLGLYFLDPSKKVEKYEAWVVNDSDVAISEVYTYLVDHEKRDNARYFLFSNAFKMIEGARLIGPGKTELKYAYENLNTSLEKGYGVSASSASKTNSQETEVREASSGYVSIEEMNWLREIALSKEVYEIVDGRPIRILVESDSITPHDDNQNLRSFTISYRYAHTDSVPQVLPTPEDVISEFELAKIDLEGMTNGSAGGYDFYSLDFNNATDFLQATTQNNQIPHAFSDADIEHPYVPLLAYFTNYSRDNEDTGMTILLFDGSTYTKTSISEIIINEDVTTGFGILMTEESSTKFGVKSGASETTNNHSMDLMLLVPTKRCLEYLYELQS